MIATSNKCMKILVDDADYDMLSKYSWSLNQKGYPICKIWINGTRTTKSVSRLLINPPKDKQVDHINGDKLDNRRDNLRMCSPQENCFNRKRRKGSYSIYKGVSTFFYTKTNGDTSIYYKAIIQVNRKPLYLGMFKTQSSAAMAYNNAAKTHFGKFALLNII